MRVLTPIIERATPAVLHAREHLALRRAVAFECIGEEESTAAKLGIEDTVFCHEIGDDVLLVTLEPAGHHSDE
jgi:hypothetical protein